MNNILNYLLRALVIQRTYKESKTPFNPDHKFAVDRDNLEKILTGNLAQNGKKFTYFIVSNPILNSFDLEEQSIMLNEIPNAIDLLNNSVWFGKFTTYGQSQIIVPNRYDLKINPFDKKIWLESYSDARYYGSGNLQYDKDYNTIVLQSELNFNDLKDIVNQTCSKYQYSETLSAWN